MTDLETQKQRAATWFKSLQDDIISRFEALEDEADRPLYTGEPGRFEKTEWSRGDGSEDLGGGRMAIMRGKFFEKVGVHFSEVYGSFSEAFRAQIPAGKDGILKSFGFIYYRAWKDTKDVKG